MTRSQTDYSADEVHTMLRAGAQHTGTHTAAAAAHLVIFCDLGHTAALQSHLRVGSAVIDGRTVEAAWVTNWRTFMTALGPHLHGGAECLLTVAEALDRGTRIDLRDWLPRAGGHAYARALIEAMTIATGYGEWYEIRPTAVLTEHEQRWAAIRDGG